MIQEASISILTTRQPSLSKAILEQPAGSQARKERYTEGKRGKRELGMQGTRKNIPRPAGRRPTFAASEVPKI
jgi:hypothetical protein